MKDFASFRKCDYEDEERGRIIPRAYQRELFQCSLSQNSILVLGTGSGKTLISIMLIKELGGVIKGSLLNGAKRTVFVVNTVPLVDQQADAIQRNSSFTVGKLKGSMGVESWSSEKWVEKLEECEVIVVVAQIFKEMIVKKRILFDQINLLIMDECHHATKEHPFSLIMSHYHQWKNLKKQHNDVPDLPRILGLTACVVNRKCCAGMEVKALVNNLENIMDCKLVTSKDQDIVKFYTTRPEEIISYFSNSEFDVNTSRAPKKIMDQLASPLKQALNIDKTYSEQHFFAKFKKLLLILQELEDNNVRILVFVDTRNRARFLHRMLIAIIKEHPSLQYLKPESMVGGATKDGLKLFAYNDTQKNILSKFRKGDCNIIFSTSVLEEGIDVQSCNVVIRFDKPKYFSSYIQSLGRARSVPSKFYLLIEENDSINLTNDLLLFKEISRQLIEVCHHKSLPNHKEVYLEKCDYNIKKQESICSSSSPIPLGDSKVACSDYQQVKKFSINKFSTLSLTNEVIKDERGIHDLTQLPINAHIKHKVVEEVEPEESIAIKSAAKTKCNKLQEIGDLDLDWMSNNLEEEIILGNSNYEIKIPTNESSDMEDREPELCARKRRQVYTRKLCRPFCNSSNLSSFFLHCINFDVCSSFLENKQHLGILSSERIECCDFLLYSEDEEEEEDVEIKVNVEFIYEISTSEEDIIDLIKYFHKVTYQSLLNINDIMMTFNQKETGHAILLAPLSSEKKLDLDLLKTISKFKSFNHFVNFRKEEPFHFVADNYVDAVVVPVYGNLDYYRVDAILTDKNPMSRFTDAKNNFKNYYKNQHKVEIQNNTQPLLKCSLFLKELINHKVKFSSMSNNSHCEHPFIPELCKVFPLKFSFLWQIYLVPSLLHRLNGLLLADELLFSIQNSPYLRMEKVFVNSPFDISWSNTAAKSSLVNGSNLVVGLNRKTSMTIYPGMILQALTSVSACDDFNLERLETLGDSFLKYVVSIYLFCKEKHYQEGQLSMARADIVSNNALCFLAKNKDIPGFFQGFILNQNTINPYGFKVKDDLEVTLRCLKVDPNQWHTFFENENKVVKNTEMAFNPCTEQVISDKSIADCVESLTGVFLLSGGVLAAKHLLIWLGLNFLQENYELSKTAIKGIASQKDLSKLYQNCHLGELENIIMYRFQDKSFLLEAITHPSKQQNNVTDSYQRLEFIGDAVLDYLITGYIYSEFRNYDPGQMTGLRSYFVNNETLGRSAVHNGLHKYLLHSLPSLTACINGFLKLLKEENPEFCFNTEINASKTKNVEIPKALGDMFEAILGAVYVDSNQSLETCWKVLQFLLKKEFLQTRNGTPMNQVRAFYETAYKIGYTPQIDYPTPIEGVSFCRIIINGSEFKPVVGEGKNKKLAKLAAAKKALLLLMPNYNIIID